MVVAKPPSISLSQVRLAQAAKGEVHDLGDFSEYADLEIEEE